MTESERDVWEAAAKRIARPFSVQSGRELVDSFGRYWDESMQKIFGDEREEER
ncbi:MAG: hypothetical protein H6833_06245 [Planctomycetes bacterium]|nr:hypothetical protein [Planctomycetota bacterium]